MFVDGCFWHQCPEHGVLPTNNREWWAAKLARNVERDAEKNEALRAMGWLSMRVWEHEDLTAVAARIEALWRSRTSPGANNIPVAGS